jgi:hypothetical protein
MAKIPESCCGGTNHPFPVGDCDYNCSVNLLDLAILASHWLEETVQQPPDYGMSDPSSVYCHALAPVRQLKVFSFFFKKNMVDSNQLEVIR